MFLTMVGNAVWGQITGSGTSENPYTGEGSLTITATDGGNVYLENATITNSSYILDLANLNGNFTIHVSGVCELGSPDDTNVAIYFPSKSNGTLTIEGNGILRIFGLQGDGNGKKTGDIIVNNSTVYFLGNIGNDSSGQHGSIAINDGIVFLDGTAKGDQTINLEQGIFFTHANNTWSGTVHTSGTEPFIINSTISGDIDGDGTVEDDENVHLTIEAPSKVQLGDGVAIERDNNQFQVTVEDGAVFKYFMAQYDQNKVNGNDVVSGNSTDYTFYGTNAYINLAGDLTCGGNTTTGVHEFLGWVDSENNMHSASKKLEDATPDSYTNPDTNGAEYVNFKAAWATQELNIGVRENEAMQDRALADQPTNTVKYESPAAGSLPDDITFNNNTFSGTAQAGTASTKPNGLYEVSVPYKYTRDGSEQSGTATVNITVTSTAPNINDGTIEFVNNTGEWYYSGAKRTTNIQIKIDDKTTLVEGVDFTVTYEYDPIVDGTTSAEGSDVVVKNAGTYTVKTITPISGKAQGDVISNPTDGSQNPLTVTIKPRTLHIQAVDQTKEIDDSKSFNETPTVYQNSTNSGTVYVTDATNDDNDYFATGENTVTNIFSGQLSISGDYSKVGTYTISCDNLELQNDGVFLKNNYTLASEKKPGTYTVTDNLSNDDVKTEIENGDGEGEGDEDKPSYDDATNTWTLTYDGKTHGITTVKKGEVEIPETGTNGEANYTISYAYKATEEGEATDLEEDGEVKNAGIYTATITFANGYEGTKTETIIINPRNLTVDLNIPETIDPEQDLSDLSNWWTKDKIELTGIVADEADEAKAKLNNASVSITGPLTSGEAIDVVVNNIKLEDNDPFLTSNYTITYKNGETTISTFETKDSTGENNDATLDDATTVGQIEINPGDDGDDITGGEDGNDDDELNDDEDFIMIVPDGEGSISVYDGEPHGLSLLIIKKKDSDVTYTLKETEDYTVSYTNEEGEDLGADVEPKHAGSYTATVTLVEDSQYQIKDSEENSFTLTIQIAHRPLEVYLNVPTTIKENQSLEDLSSWWNSSKITFNEGGFANDTEKGKAVETLSNAKASIEGPLTVGESVDVMLQDIELKDSDPFFTSNYTITYKKDNTAVEGITLSDEDEDNSDDDATIEDGTEVEESDKTELDPDDSDTIGGEDENNDGDLDDDNDFILLSPDGDTYASVYDGDEHALTMLKFGNTTLNVGTDYTVSGYTSDDDPNVGENSLPKHAATYSATVTLTNDDYKWKDGRTSHTFNNITINKRPMYLTLRSGVTFRSAADVTLEALIEEQPMGVDEGLVNGEQPKYSGEPVVEQVSGTHWTATISREDFQVLNGDNFYVSDYDITLYDASSEGEGDGEDLTDDGKLPDGGGDDIVVDIIVNPEIPFEPGGNHGSGWDKPEYYNIYIDTICPGLNVEVSKDVVQEGHQVSVYLTIQSECDTTGMRFEYKRGLFGWWEDLKPLEDVQPGEYIIKNIYTDIYIRALDATMPDDATALEAIEGIKAYAQDGNIYVYTPNRMPVWIVSMTGAVLRNEEQVGLQAYDRLTRGIYIVRVGEQVFKIRL